MIRILSAILFVVLLFFILVYTSTNKPALPRIFSNAQEAISNLIDKSVKNDSNSLPPVNLTLINTVFSPGDDIVLQYDGDFNSLKDLSFDLRNNSDKSVPIKVISKEDEFDKSLRIETSKKMSLGKYKLIIKQGQKELINAYVYLGTIVINNQQSQYEIGENYISDVVFLDEKGEVSCIYSPSFDILNTISGESDKLQVTGGNCDKNNPSPYRLSYTPKISGTYVLKNPVGEVGDAIIQASSFEVSDTAPPIMLKREGPIFVNPNDTYEMAIEISANENFQGVVTDFIPVGISVMNSSNFSLQPFATSFDKSSINLRKPFNGDSTVTLGFGEDPDNPSLSYNYKNYGIKNHDGIDFALPDDTPIIAVDDGKVIEFPSKLLAAYGNTIVLEHLWGGRTFYGHLNTISVKIGQKIGKGEVIGFSGHTGFTTGPHLHFGLDLKNSDVNNGYLGKIDPTSYLSANNDLNSSLYKVSWNISINKGEKKELGYVFKLPVDDYGYPYYELGPINIVNKDNEVIFKDSRRWTLIKE